MPRRNPATRECPHAIPASVGAGVSVLATEVWNLSCLYTKTDIKTVIKLEAKLTSGFLSMVI